VSRDSYPEKPPNARVSLYRYVELATVSRNCELLIHLLLLLTLYVGLACRSCPRVDLGQTRDAKRLCAVLLPP
jgi:hypothetical protein